MVGFQSNSVGITHRGEGPKVVNVEHVASRGPRERVPQQGSPLAVLSGRSPRTKSENSIFRPDKIPPPGQKLDPPGHENLYFHAQKGSINAA